MTAIRQLVLEDKSVPLIIITREMSDFIAAHSTVFEEESFELLHYFTMEDEESIIGTSTSGYPKNILFHVGVYGDPSNKYNVENVTETLVKQGLILKTKSVSHYVCIADDVNDPYPKDENGQIVVSRPMSRMMWAIVMCVAVPGKHTYEYEFISFFINGLN
jgi:hypothetical protein